MIWAWVEGKTAITLTAIYDLCLDSFEVRKVLVIAPLRVARDTWPTEIEKWDHLKGLSYSVAVGTEAERRAALLQRASVYIINRENLTWLIEDSGLPFDFDMVVIDELSSFKSHRAKRFKSLLKARPAVKRIVGLTGTPSSNGLMDLWAEFRILDLGERLGRYISRYRERFFMPDKRNGMVVFSYKPLPGAEEAIYSQISDITISMKAEDYLQMPECVLANGAIYGNDGKIIAVHDKKLDALEDLIEAANGKPVLVAYWFKHDLERIKKRFDVREIKTSADIADWNNGDISVAVIHPASAGHGLNLQAGGSTLIWFGITWSLELYQQTNARLWRQGQQSKTVVIYHIVAEKTIDEQIIRALEKKDKTQAALIDAVKANLEV